MGEKFVLCSQHEILENQIKITRAEKQEFEYESSINLRQLDKQSREGQRARQELELEIRGLEQVLGKQKEDHYHNTMYLMKDERGEAEVARRHEFERDIDISMIDKKRAEITQL